MDVVVNGTTVYPAIWYESSENKSHYHQQLFHICFPASRKSEARDGRTYRRTRCSA